MEKKRLQTIVLGDRKLENTLFISTQHSQHSTWFWGNYILAATASVKVRRWECNVSVLLTRALLLFHILNVFVILQNKILAGPLIFVRNRALCPVLAAWARVIALLDVWLDPQAEGKMPLVSGTWLTVTCFNMPRLHWPMAHDSLFLNPNLPDRSMKTQSKCSYIWTSRDDWIHLCPSD